MQSLNGTSELEYKYTDWQTQCEIASLCHGQIESRRQQKCAVPALALLPPPASCRDIDDDARLMCATGRTGKPHTNTHTQAIVSCKCSVVVCWCCTCHSSVHQHQQKLSWVELSWEFIESTTAATTITGKCVNKCAHSSTPWVRTNSKHTLHSTKAKACTAAADAQWVSTSSSASWDWSRKRFSQERKDREESGKSLSWWWWWWAWTYSLITLVAQQLKMKKILPAEVNQSQQTRETEFWVREMRERERELINLKQSTHTHCWTENRTEIFWMRAWLAVL